MVARVCGDDRVGCAWLPVTWKSGLLGIVEFVRRILSFSVIQWYYWTQHRGE